MLALAAAAFILTLLLAAAAGAMLGARAAARSGAGPGPGDAGFLWSGATGLLSLLIGFTFALSAERFETRRELVVAEANALSTAYLRDSLFPAPFNARLGALLADYGRFRLDFFPAGRDPTRLAEVAARTGARQDAIWKETAAALRTPRGAALTTAVLNATNGLFDLAARRQAASQAPVPRAVLWLLALTAIGTAGLCGYNLRLGGNRHWLAATTLLVMVAAAIALILDLDWPAYGLITVPQQPLIDQAAELMAHERDRQAFVPPDPPTAPEA